MQFLFLLAATSCLTALLAVGSVVVAFPTAVFAKVTVESVLVYIASVFLEGAVDICVCAVWATTSTHPVRS